MNARVSLVRTRTIPNVPDYLCHAECQERAQASRGDTATPVDRSPFAPCEEQKDENGNEKEPRTERDETKGVLGPVVPSHEVVKCLEGRVVQLKALKPVFGFYTQ